jgi:hypothetical protein
MMNKLIYSLLVLATSLLPFHAATAQKIVQYLQYEDLKTYHFGFSIGMHTQDLIMDHSGATDTNGDRWYGSVNNYTPGFSVGVIADLRLADFLSLRTTPTIHFGSKDVTLLSDAAGSTPVTANVRSNYILVPLSLRYRGARTDNYRPYIISGISAGIDMGRDKQQPLLLQPINMYWEIGAGCDIYMPYFRLVPELKVCLGMGDILVHNRTDQSSDAFLKYANAFDAITSRLIVFSVQFE